MAIILRNNRYHAVWRDPAGRQCSKSCGPGPAGKQRASELLERIAAEKLLGCYEDRTRQRWADFRAEYDRLKQPKPIVTNVLAHFERICNPAMMAVIDTKAIDEYVAVRRDEPGRKDDTIAHSTINKELATLRAVMRLACRWGYLKQPPEFSFLETHDDEPQWVPPADFALLYHACEAARRPEIPNVTPGQWWQAFLLYQYMTGWRVGQVLAIKIDNVDFDRATVLSPWADTKSRRAERLPIHEVLMEAMEPLRACRLVSDRLFPWEHPRSCLYDELRVIERQAGMTIGGFHSLRRSFATNNAAQLDLFELQGLMCHRSLRTTKRYVAMAKRLNRSVSKIAVPNLEKMG